MSGRRVIGRDEWISRIAALAPSAGLTELNILGDALASCGPPDRLWRAVDALREAVIELRRDDRCTDDRRRYAAQLEAIAGVLEVEAAARASR